MEGLGVAGVTVALCEIDRHHKVQRNATSQVIEE